MTNNLKNKKLLIIAVIFIAVLVNISFLYADQASGTTYKLANSSISSGGVPTSKDSKQVIFQAVGQNAKGFSFGFKDGETATGYKSVYGLHFSSDPYSISGVDSQYYRDVVTMNATDSGLFTTKLDFKVKYDGVTQDISTDMEASDGWECLWNTESSPKVTADAQVEVLASGFDGLTWSGFYRASSFYVDNEAPGVSSLLLLAEGNALNSELGTLSGSWSGSDNLDTSLVYDLYYSNVTTLNVMNAVLSPTDITGLTLWLDANDPNGNGSQLSDGVGVSLWSDKSGNNHDLSQYVSSYKPTYIASMLNNKPVFRFDGGDYLRTQSLIGSALFSSNESHIFVVIKQQLSSSAEVLFSWQSAEPSNRVGNEFEASKIRFDFGNDSTGKVEYNSYTPDPSFHVVEYVRTDSNVQKIIEDSIDLVSATRSQSLNTSAYSPFYLGGYAVNYKFSGDVAEVLIYKEALSETDQANVRNYLQSKWFNSGGGDEDPNWTQIGSNVSATSIVRSSEQDNSGYLLKVVAIDDAGNQTEDISTQANTPDRTAPVMDPLLTEIAGTEDINWVYDLTSKKSDTTSYETGLTWDVEVYTYLQDPGKSAEEILKSAVISNGVTDTLSFIVSPNCNTASPLNGNIYGKENAYIKLGLFDEAGNYVYRDININLEAVNDRPEILNDIGLEYNEPGYIGYRDQSNYILYNIKTNEDVTASIITLDDLVRDVDNEKEDLLWTVSYENTSFYQVGNIPYDASYDARFDQDGVVKVLIGDRTAGHDLYLVPSSNYYGDIVITINVTDNDMIPTYDSQEIILRVWPVNDAPEISGSLPSLTQVDEDNNLVLSLRAYENDKYNEDTAPTYNNNLDWSVVTYNQSFVTLVEGENSAADQITFTPVPNKYGTCNVVLRLTDVDEVPESVFNLSEPTKYLADPKSSTVSMTLVWYPVNDPPVIGAISVQTTTEDIVQKLIDISSYKVSDVEDTVADLVWSGISYSLPGYISSNLDDANDILTITPELNAWGTINATISLVDIDQSINFPGYVPNPQTVTTSFQINIKEINDVPSLASIMFKGASTNSQTTVMFAENLVASASSLTDVGYAADTELAVIGSEYVGQDIPALDYQVNVPYYNFHFKADGLDTVARRLLVRETTFSFSDEYEGKTVTVDIYPDDDISSGNVMTEILKINSRPAIVVPDQPMNLSWHSTQNVIVSWNLTTDADVGDSIYYRFKAWKTADWRDPVPNTANVTPFYDSGWMSGDFHKVDTAVMGKLFDHGTYYWTVYSANEFLSDVWDYREPDWLKKFHVDIIAPTYNSIEDAVSVVDIIADPDAVEFAGMHIPLYGLKPEETDDEYYYSVWLERWNEHIVSSVMVYSHENEEIVPLTNADEWYAYISFQEGTTTCNLYFMDRAGNTSNYQEFVVGEDRTPPMVPVLNISADKLVNGVYEILTSADTYIVYGHKDADEKSSVWFEGINSYILVPEIQNTEVFGMTTTTNFYFPVGPDKPSGSITARDMAELVSVGSVSINVTFLIGSVPIEITDQTRVTINSHLNPGLSGYSTAIKTAISSVDVTWVSDRDLVSYELYNQTRTNEDDVIASGGAVNQGVPVVTTIMGSNQYLSEGENTIVIKAVDMALNQGFEEFNIIRLTEGPVTTNTINKAEAAYESGDSWEVDIRIKPAAGVSVNIKVGNISDGWVEIVPPVDNQGEWWFGQSNINLRLDNIYVELEDEVYNKSEIILWTADENCGTEKQSFQAQGASGILQSYDSLPANLITLYSRRVKKGVYATSTGLGIMTQDKAMTMKTESSDLMITDELTGSIYQLYGKYFSGQYVTDINLTDHNVKIAIPYSDDVKIDENNLVPIFFDNETNAWKRGVSDYAINTKLNRVVTKIDSAGLWALAEYRAFAVTLDNLRVYPNPWYPNDGNVNTGDSTGIRFDNLTNESRVRIYTISGQKVCDEDPSSSIWIWDGKNMSGRSVVSGTYLYIITDGAQKKTGKLTIIK